MEGQTAKTCRPVVRWPRFRKTMTFTSKPQIKYHLLQLAKVFLQVFVDCCTESYSNIHSKYTSKSLNKLCGEIFFLKAIHFIPSKTNKTLQWFVKNLVWALYELVWTGLWYEVVLVGQVHNQQLYVPRKMRSAIAAISQLSSGNRRDTPQTDRQYVTGTVETHRAHVLSLTVKLLFTQTGFKSKYWYTSSPLPPPRQNFNPTEDAWEVLKKSYVDNVTLTYKPQQFFFSFCTKI